MNTRIYCPDIECESCIRLLTKTFENNLKINNFTINKEYIDIAHEDSFEPKDIISLINEKGFRAGFDPFLRKTFSERFRDFIQNKSKYETEYKIIKYWLAGFGLLLMIELIFFYVFLKDIPGFLSKYAIWLFYLDLVVVSISSAVLHIRSYKVNIKDMAGMMIGMTFGMQTGMMIGTIIGYTNGLFMGCIVGMLTGVFIGVLNGKCCGIMGIMEGMMAGIMGGVMGGMTGVMFLVDKANWFMPPFMILNLIVIFSLSYMMFEEVIEGNLKIIKNNINFLTYFLYIFIIITILSLIMIYGIKTGVASL